MHCLIFRFQRVSCTPLNLRGVPIPAIGTSISGFDSPLAALGLSDFPPFFCRRERPVGDLAAATTPSVRSE